MTSYNKPQFVGRVIESILNQTFTDFELFLMDDNSNEETQKVIKTYLQDTRIKYFRSGVKSVSERTNSIRYAVLINKALDMAAGKYITYATDDNIYRPERLYKMVNYLDNKPEVQIVYCACNNIVIDERGRIIKNSVLKANSITWVAPCITDHCTVMHRKSILPVIYEKWGSYWDENPEFYLIGDARFFWRLNHFWPFYPLNVVLNDNYITEQSLHYQLYTGGDEDNFAAMLPPQRTCKELRDYLRSRMS